MEKVIGFSLFILLLLHAGGCFHTYEANELDTTTLSDTSYTDCSAKVFLKNNTYLIFPRGFTVRNGYIEGDARIVEREYENKNSSFYNIPFDSISAMVTFDETTSGFRHFGNFLYAITVPGLVYASVYCLICPKCCFGSCPTIYTNTSGGSELQAELFSECISRQLEDGDLDMLNFPINADELELRITNEALETHYINKFEFVVAEHPLGTKLYPAVNNELLVFSDLVPPAVAINKKGEDVSCLLTTDDGEYYRSGADEVQSLKKGVSYDFIEIKVPAEGKEKIKMMMKYRNTLLSTTLLYDVVIGSQGIDAMGWQAKMNNDAQYASFFKLLYNTFSGINIKVLNDGKWENAGKFKDAGPLNWKYIAAELPACGEDTIHVRLEFIPDNFMIDYISFDCTGNKEVPAVSKIDPVTITDRTNNKREDVWKYISGDDDKYLVTEPGDSYTINYFIGKKGQNERTAFIYSRGYYIEWIRGDWISNKSPETKFNLYDIRGTLSKLADSWTENRQQLEDEFFRTRVNMEKHP